MRGGILNLNNIRKHLSGDPKYRRSLSKIRHVSQMDLVYRDTVNGWRFGDDQ